MYFGYVCFTIYSLKTTAFSIFSDLSELPKAGRLKKLVIFWKNFLPLS